MKKALSLVTAILMLSALTACKSDGNSAEATNETTSAAVQEETSAETKAENKTETQAETKAETEVSEAGGGYLYSGNGYTVKIDGAKWMDASEYVKLISEYVEDTNLIDITAEEYQSMNDGMFYHTNMDGTNLNIVCNPIGNTDNIDLRDGVDLFKEQYKSMGITWIGDEIVEINGLEWLKIDVETSLNGPAMKMRQCMAMANGNQYILSFSSEKDKYDSTLSDFEEVLNSFELTE